MTGPGEFRRPADDGGIRLSMDVQVPVGAGQTVDIPVLVVHDGPGPTSVTLSVLGLDPRWIPAPVTVAAIAPGETVELVLRIPVERGALAARYPFVVAAQAEGTAGGRPQIAVAESVLVVDAQERLALVLRPLQPIAVFRRRFEVTVTNPGQEPRTVSLHGETAAGAGIFLDRAQVDVPAGRTASVGGRLSVRRPRLFGTESTYPFTVTGRSTGAAQTAEGVFRSRPLIRSWLSGLVAVLTVLALWAAIGLIVIPRLSDRFAGTDATTAAQQELAQSRQAAAAQSASDAAAGSAAASSAAASAATGGGGADGGGADGDGGGAGTDAGTAGGSGTGGNARLAGSVESGSDPGGTTVVVEPTTVVQAQQEGAQEVSGLVAPATAEALRDGTAIGKVWGSALRTAPGDDPAASRLTTTTADDGTWSFGGLVGPGFYLVTFARAGYQTQRFVVDSALLGAGEPMKVTLLPGQGSMSGTVTSASGPVGSATVAITDGTTTLTTSTVSSGADQGTWSVNGLATPGEYLITVTATGYGTESALTSLPAGGRAVTDLDLQTGVASITGQVSGRDQFGNVGGLGGLTVTAVAGDVTRTATTITAGAVGRFALPDLPTPGEYTLTVSGAGYQSQTQQIALAAGAGNAEVAISMTRADGVVAGTVFDETGAGLPGAGLTLTGPDATLKTMTASSPAGSYRFGGVLPGLYVLSATMYGRQTAFATVEITAAETVTTDLTMPLSESGAVPADSRIRGRAVDNRTAGPLNCDRAPTPVIDCRATVTTTMTTLDGVQQTITTTATPAGDYTLPALDDVEHPGLLPGLYSLSFEAPGFEPQTITVQVAQSQIVAAPQVSMQPLGRIFGQVTGVVATPDPARPTCIVAAAASATLPDSCTVVPPDPAVPDSVATCTAGADVRCALTDANGNYDLRGFRSGGYVVRALPTDPDFIPTDPVQLQLAVSEEKQYSPRLDRKAHLTVTVLVPDDITGALNPRPGVVVAIALVGRVPEDPADPAPGPTGDGGTVTFTALASGAYDVVIQPGQGLTGRTQSATLSINQDGAVQVIGTVTYGAVVGRVLTVVDGVAQPLGGARVQITGSVSVGNSNGLLPGSATVTTDANGCYAILSMEQFNAGLQPTSAECTTGVSGAARGHMVFAFFGFAIDADLAVRSVGVTVTDPTVPPRTQPFQANPVVAAPPVAPETSYTLQTFTIAAQPVPLGDWAVRTDFATPGLVGTGAAVSVTRKPAAAGNVTVSLAGNGALGVTDDVLPAPNILTPGLYQLHAVALGYLPADADLWCGLGQQCRLLPFGTVNPNSPPTATQPPSDPNALTLRRVGLMAGRITLPAGGAQTPLAFTAVQVVRTPSGAGAITVRVNADGTVVFTDSRFGGLPPGNLATPGEYEFSLSLSGYNPITIRVACDSGNATRGGRCYQITDQQTGPSAACIADPTQCNALSVTLASLPSFAGTIDTNLDTLPNGTAVNLTQVSVAVTQQAVASSVITVTVNADGTINWRDQSLDPVAQLANTIQAGNYTITASLPGYLSTQSSYSFTCTSGSCGPGTITLRSLPRPSVLVVANPAATGLDFPSAVISITARPSGTGGLSGTATPVAGQANQASITWNDTALPFPGIVSPGDYQFRINVAGYEQSGLLALSCPATDTQSACTFSGPGVSGGIVTLARFPLLANGTWSVAPADPSVQPSIQVTAAPSGAGPISVTPNADGTLTWSETGLPIGLVRPGSYQLAISADGYDTRTYPFTCVQGNTCTPPNLALSKAGTLTLTLVSSRDGKAAVTGASVTLSGTSIPSNSVTLAPTENSVSFSNISAVDPTAYSVRVQAGGFAFTTVTAASPATTVTCSGSAGTDVPGLRVQPGDTSCTIRLTQRGQLTGTTLGVGTSGGRPVNDALSQVLITAQRTAAPDGTPVTDAPLSPVRSDPDGGYLLTGTNQVDGMLDGTWSVTATRTGYVDATGTVTVAGGLITAATGGLALNQATQRVTISLAVQPVNLRVQLSFGADFVTSGVQIEMTDSTFARVALCGANQAGSTKCTLPVSPINYYEFTAINPGVYTLKVTSTTYREVTTQVSVVAGQSVQSTVVSLSSGSSTVSGNAVSALTRNALASATADLVTEADPDNPALSTTGVPLTTTTDAQGNYVLADVKFGRYQVRITKDGYETWRSPLFGADAAANPNVSVQQAVVIRSSRVLTLTLASSAAGAPTFSGTTITLTPTPDPNLDFGPALTGNVGDNNTVTFNSVPTGTYTATAGKLNGPRPFSTAGLYSTTVVVGASPPPSPPPVAATLTIDETPVTFAATLTGGTCATTTPTSLTASVVRTSPAQTAEISMSISGTTATSEVTYLPNTAFSWSVLTTGQASFWTSPTQNFTTAGTASTQSITLQPGRVAVPVSVTLNNAAGIGASVQATAAGQTADPVTIVAGNNNRLCLTPAVQWSISLSGPTVYVGSTQLLTPTVATPGTYSYTGQVLAPTVSLQAVSGRTGDARAVVLALFSGTDTSATPLFSTTLNMAAGTNSATPPNTIYAPPGNYTWTATPPAADVYAPASATASLPAGGSSPVASALTLTYNRVVATISTTRDGVAQPGAAITITAGAVTRTGQTAGAGGSVTLYDLPTGSWTVTAQYVDNTTNPATTYRGTLTPAVSPTASPTAQTFGPIVLTVVP